MLPLAAPVRRLPGLGATKRGSRPLMSVLIGPTTAGRDGERYDLPFEAGRPGTGIVGGRCSASTTEHGAGAACRSFKKGVVRKTFCVVKLSDKASRGAGAAIRALAVGCCRHRRVTQWVS